MLAGGAAVSPTRSPRGACPMPCQLAACQPGSASQRGRCLHAWCHASCMFVHPTPLLSVHPFIPVAAMQAYSNGARQHCMGT